MNVGAGGIEFEIDVQARFTALGWSVERTAVTGDFGADLVARSGTEILVVQCKDYGSPAGIKAIQEAHFARAHYGASAAAVVARSGFTKAATQAAATSGVHIFRPLDVAGGSPFDRTRFQEELKRRQWTEDLARENDRASDTWARYDVALLRHEKITRIRLYLLKLLCASGSLTIVVLLFLILYGDRYQVITYLAAAQGLFLLVSFRTPRAPAIPGFNRRGRIVACRSCKRRLRIDFGRAGEVMCPNCRSLTTVAIPTLNFRGTPVRADESFFA